MPTYPYHCVCGHTEDVVKPISMYQSLEPCCECGSLMDKDWSQMVPTVKVYAGHYNHSLGAYIGSEGQQRDVCEKIYEKTGTKPVAIGDFKPEHKPQLKGYNVPRGVFDA